ncbi:MAG TPA: hypothetical protein VFF12_05595, partial [Myxococcaceae bacterium]|nr:hypothetical protein [Myxococcaceae bacterium]
TVGGILASAVLVGMAVGPLWGALCYLVLVSLCGVLLGIAERRLDRLRDRFRMAAPDLFSRDGLPRIPER